MNLRALDSALALALALALAACSGGSKPAAASAARSYAVRGEVVRLPAAGQAGGELMVRHEAIDDFADASGKVVGMGSMTMGFTVTAQQAAGLAPGDKVSLRFTVDFAGPRLQVDGLEKLPPGTALEFRPARPPG